MISLVANVGGLRAQDGLFQAARAMQVSLERLSTGLRINRAEDDAAGLMLRDRFRSQMFGLEEGMRNIQAAQGMVQVAEQGLTRVTESLHNIRMLAVRAADDNLNDRDRAGIQEQIQGLLKEINDRAKNTVYNGTHLLDGSITDGGAARQAAVQIQSNQILANGGRLLADASVPGDAAAAGSVSQGSYEVRIVHGGADRSYVTQTSRTVLGGKSSSGLGYLNSGGVAGTVVTRNETVVDRQGERHQATFTFTSTGAAQWSWRITAQNGGAWTSGLDTSGTIAFDEYTGQISGFTTGTPGSSTPAGTRTAVVAVADGTAAGQKWAVDFSKLRNVAHPAVVDAPVEPANGTLGGSETTEVTFHSQLDPNLAVGSTTPRLGISSWIDRAGATHDVGFTFTKVADPPGGGTTWSMSVVGLSGGVWTGVNRNADRVRLDFDASGRLVGVNGAAGVTDATVNVGDGTEPGQNVVVHMARLRTGTTPSPIGINHVSATHDGTSTLPTHAVAYTGNLDKDVVAPQIPPFSFTQGLSTWVDRLGDVHQTSVTFTKTASNTWNYSISGLAASGAWTGQTNGADSGTLHFDDAGHLTDVVAGAIHVGASPFTLKLGDSTVDANGDPLGAGAGQDVSIDFTAVTQLSDATPGHSHLANVADGTSTAPGTTTTTTYNGVIDSSGAPVGTTAAKAMTWYDRNGTQHAVTLNLVKSANASGDNGLQDLWSYSFSGLTGTGSAGSGAPGVAWNGTLGTSAPASGTIAFDTAGNVTTPQTLGLVINDGTDGGQAVHVDLTPLQNLNPIVAPGGSQDGTATAPHPTTAASYTGILDKDLLVSSSPSFTSQNVTWYDRLGVGHATSMTFAKTGVNQWSYSLNGLQDATGAWTGLAPGGPASGTLRFDDAGRLIAVNGSSTGSYKQFDVTVANDVIGGGQTVHVDLGSLVVPGITQSGQAGITQPGNGPTTDSTVQRSGSTVPDGSNPPPGITTAASYGGALDADAAVGDSTSTVFNWYDRNAVHHAVTLTLTKAAPDGIANAGLADRWNWSLSSAASGVWAGGISQGGTLLFGADGRTSGLSVNVADGTNAGQTVAVDLSSLLVRAARAGPAGIQNGQVSAPRPTTLATFAGVLDKDLTPGSVLTTAPTAWYDRGGAAHTVSLTFTKQAFPQTNTWSYSVNGLTAANAWLGGVTSGPATGTVRFDDAGHVLGVNGGSATTFGLVVKDDTWNATTNPAGGQSVTLDFSSLSQPTNASTAQTTADQVASNAANGSATAPGLTTTTSYSGIVDASALVGTSVSKNLTFHDRNGGAHTVTLTLSKSVDSTGARGLADTWHYSFTGLSGSGSNAYGATWSGARSGDSGSITFNADGTLPSTAFNLLIDDGTTAGQSVGTTLTALQSLFPIAAPSGSQDGTAVHPNPTTQVSYTGILDKDLLPGPTSTYTTQSVNWFDRLGTAHATSVTYTKTATNTWSYSINGLRNASGAWSGGVALNGTGTLTFDDAGNLLGLNGGTSKTVVVGVDDDVIGSAQNVTVDFGSAFVSGITQTGKTGITQPGNGPTTDSTVAQVANTAIDGNNTTPGTTFNATYAALLDSTASIGASTSTQFNWFDRDGVSHAVTLTVNKTADSTGATGLADTWTYTFAAPAASGTAWASGVNATGTFAFDSTGHVTSPVTVTVDDGTIGHQAVSVDVSRLEVRNPLAALGGTQNVGTPVPPDPTTLARFAGLLDRDQPTGTVETTAAHNWYDRLGNAHSVSLAFTRTAVDTWSYSLVGLTAGGRWTGGASAGAATGTLVFDPSGNLLTVNGHGSKQESVTVADDAGGQAVTLDFGATVNGNSGVIQPSDATASTVGAVANSSADGSATPPAVTSSATWTGVLDASAGAAPVSKALTWYDRSGEAHAVTLTLTKSSDGTGNAGLQDRWSYSFTGLSGAGGGAHPVTWSGLSSGSSSGTLSFNTDGTVASPATLSFVVADGTSAGQAVTVSLGSLLSRSPITAPAGSQNVSVPVTPDPTTVQQVAGVLDYDQPDGTVESSPSQTWYDRLGQGHTVHLDYQRQNASTWTYSVVGLTTAAGAWTGAAATGAATGTLVFDGAGNLAAVNGGVSKQVSLTTADDAGGQAVTLDFGATVSGVHGLTQASDATHTTAAQPASTSATGSQTPPPAVTTAASFTAVLDATNPSAAVTRTVTWYDRNGGARNVTLTLNKSMDATGNAGLADQWTYTIGGLTGTTGPGPDPVTWSGVKSGSDPLTGTLTFNTDGSLASPTHLALAIADATAAGQSVAVDLSGLVSRSPITTPAGSQDVAMPRSPHPTTLAQFAGILDRDQPGGTVESTATQTWYDRLGQAHSVSLSFTKSTTVTDRWDYSVVGLAAGGAWTGGAASGATGYLTFSATGTLLGANGGASKQAALIVNNDAGGQAVTLDFGATLNGNGGVTQPSDAGGSTVGAAANASNDGSATAAPTPTTSATYGGLLDAGAGAAPVTRSLTWYDRNGTAHAVTLTLTQHTNNTGNAGLADTWDYSFNGLSSAGTGAHGVAWGGTAGTSDAASGTLTFNADGTLASPTALHLIVADGTAAGQAVSVDLGTLVTRSAVASPTGSQDVTTQLVAQPTTLARMAGILDRDQPAGTVETSATQPWYDRLGNAHSVSIAFTKSGTVSGRWDYRVVGLDHSGTWAGGAASGGTGYLSFDATGALLGANGTASKQAALVVADDVAGQAVTIDFGAALNGNSGVTQPSDATGSTVGAAANSVVNGSASPPAVTSRAAYTGTLDASAGASPTQFAGTWYDRNGGAHTVTLHLTQSADQSGASDLQDSWSYSFEGLSGASSDARGVAWSGLTGLSDAVSGTVAFNADGTLSSPASLSFYVADGTGAGQHVTVNLAALITRTPVAAPTGAQDVAAAQHPDATTLAQFAGVLDRDQAPGATESTATQTWYDRLGKAHSVSLAFTKSTTVTDRWNYSVVGLAAGGAWTGGAASGGTGYLTFDAGGALLGVNGGTSKQAALTVNNDAGGQALTLDFGATVNGLAGITQPSDATGSTVGAPGNSSADGTATAPPTPTHAATYTGILDASAAAAPVTKGLTWYDRNGTAHNVTLTLTKTADATGNSGLADTWSYSLGGLSSAGTGAHGVTWGGTAGGSDAATGSVTFKTDGTLASPAALHLILADGTAGGQAVAVNLGALTSYSPIVAPSGSQNVVTPHSPHPTAVAQYAGILDADLPAGTQRNTAATTWYDRLGQAHSVSVAFTKSTAVANRWDFSVAGLSAANAWTGGAGSGGTGYLTFDATGTLLGVNGGASRQAALTVNDDAGGQAVTLDFGATVNGNAGIRQPSDATGSTVGQAANTVVTPTAAASHGPDPTTTETFAAKLDGTASSQTLTWYDRLGVGHAVTLALTHTTGNQWSYSVSGLSASSGAWAGNPPTGATSGTLVFGTGGALSDVLDGTGASLGTGALSFVVDDGTTGHQKVSVSFAGIATVAATANGSATAPTPTTAASYGGNLDANRGVGYVFTTDSAAQWFDRLGTGHHVNLTFTKTGTNAWSYSVNGLPGAGGAWTGTAPTGPVAGNVTFSGGALASVNGAAGATGFNLTVADDTPGGQPIHVDLTPLTQNANGTPVLTAANIQTAQDGSTSTPGASTGLAVSGSLNATVGDVTAAPTDTENVRTFTTTLYDKTGTAHSDVTVTLRKTIDHAGLDDTWSYTVAAGASGVWSSGLNATGTIAFDLSGNATASPQILHVTDGAGTTQDVTLDVSGLHSVATAALSGTVTAGTPTASANFGGELDADAATSDANARRTVGATWYDATGGAHTVTLDLTKAIDVAGRGDTWNYSLHSAAVVPWTAFATTGQLGFDAATGAVSSVSVGAGNATVSGTTLTQHVADGTVGGQDVAVRFSGLNSVTTDQAAGTQTGGSTAASHPTTLAEYGGPLDANTALGSGVTRTLAWYDRIGQSHSVGVQFTRTAIDRWTYSIAVPAAASGVWTGAIAAGSGPVSGTLAFDTQTGALTGAAPFTVKVDDGTVGGQAVTVDFTAANSVPALSQFTNGSSTAALTLTPATSHGPDPTTTENFAAKLDGGAPAGATAAQTLTWYDRLGAGHAVTLNLTRTAAAGNRWSYSVQGLDAAASAWTGAVTGASRGTLVFDGAGALQDVLDGGGASLGTGALTLSVADGTSGTQRVAVTFTGIASVAATANGSATVPTPTTSASYGGVLDGDLAAGSPVSTDATAQWFDRLGRAHNVNVTFHRTGTGAWDYTLNGLPGSGGAWAGGAAPAHATGTLQFDGSGALTAVNGSSAVGFDLFNVVVADDTGAGQTVAVSFHGLSQVHNAPLDDTTVGLSANANVDGDSTAPTPTTSATFSAHLDAFTAGAAASSAAVTWYDRNGKGHSVTLALSKAIEGTSPLGDTWNYTVQGLSGTGAAGSVAWSAPANATGQIAFDANGNPTTTSLALHLADGTTAGQGVTVDLSDVRNDASAPAPLGGSQDVAAPQASDQTSHATYGGILDADLGIGFSVTSNAAVQWIDRLGTSHTVNATFTKTAANTWSYRFNGLAGASGAWTGSSATGTITFDPTTGALTSPPTFAVTVADGTSGGQAVAVDFSGLSQRRFTPVDDTTVGNAANGTSNGTNVAPTLTTSASYAASLDAEAAVTASVSKQLTWFDRNGDGHAVTLLLTKASDGATPLADTWSYSFQGLATTGAGGVAWTPPANASGTLTFDANGNVTTPTLSLHLGDGTTGGQTVAVDLTNVRVHAGAAHPVVGTQDVATQHLSDQTTAAAYHGVLDADLGIGFPVTTDSGAQWFDRTGIGHSVRVTYARVADNRWSYTFNGLPGSGGAWTGATTGASSGTLVFNATTGAVQDVLNGAGASLGTTPFTLTVADGTTSGQTVAVNFSALTQQRFTPVDDSTISITANSAINGANVHPHITSSAGYHAHLDAAAAVSASLSTAFNWYDRNGDSHSVTLHLTKASDGASPLADTWSYSFQGLDTTGAGGVTWTRPANASGNLVFDANGNPTTASLALHLADGSTAGQDVTVDLSDVRNDASTIAPVLTGSQNVATVHASDQTMQAAYGGILDADLGIGFSVTTNTGKQWYDRLGAAHTVDVTFTRAAAHTWSYTFNGLGDATGAWTGSSASGTVTFDPSSGALTSTPSRTLTLADGTTAGQAVQVDFSGLTEHRFTPVDDTTVGVSANSAANGDNTAPTLTATATYSAHLDARAAVSSAVSTHFNWYDRNGIGHDVTLLLTKASDGASDLADTWSYAFQGLTGTGSAGGATWSAPANASGQLAFDASGNVTTPSLSLLIGDGTTAGQTVTVNLASVRTDGANATALSGTQSVASPQASNQTDSVTYGGLLDADLRLGSTVTTDTTAQWFDRLGQGHSAYLTYTRVAADHWTYSIHGLPGAGGAWNGSAAPTGSTGDLLFNASTGALLSPSSLDLFVPDATTSGQKVTVHFTVAETHTASADDTSLGSESANGSNRHPTLTASAAYSAHLDARAAVNASVSTHFNWYDRNGIGHDVTLLLSKAADGASDLSDTWSYSFQGLSGTGNAGSVSWSAPANASGQLTFDANGNITTPSLSLLIGDGTTAGQTVTVDLSTVRNDASAVSPLNGSQDVATPQASNQTDAATFAGVLDADLGIGSTLASNTVSWFDRLGVASHAVSVTYHKATVNTWQYTINGLTPGGGSGAWTGGAASSNATGTLTFNSSGALTAVNGSSASGYARLDVAVADGTSTSQHVAVDFSGLTQPRLTPVDDTTVGTSANSMVDGSSTVPTITTTADYTAHLDSTAAAGASQTTRFTWYDRKAAAHTVTLTLNKSTNPTDLPDAWTYTIGGLNTSGAVGGVAWGGDTLGHATGTIAFDASGNPTTSSIALNIVDGTSGGQAVTVRLLQGSGAAQSGVRNDAAPDSTPADPATLTALSGSQTGTATPPHPTASTAYSGVLDADLGVGATLTTDTGRVWYDRLGDAHNVYLRFAKTDTNRWTYSLVGLQGNSGAWTGGAPGGPVSGTLQFTDAGALAAVNGTPSSTVGFAGFNVQVADDVIGSPQVVHVDLSGLTQPGNGPTTDGTVQSAGATIPNVTASTVPGLTHNVAYTGHLDATAAVGFGISAAFGWYDRNGDAHTVTMTVRKLTNPSGLGDTWSYTMSGLSSTGSGGVTWGGDTTGNSGGTLTFDANGNLTSPLTVGLKIADGTVGGHNLTVDFSAMKNDAAPGSPLTGTADGDGTRPNPTASTQYSGNLDGDLAVGAQITTPVAPTTKWYDRLGIGHGVTVTYTKIDTDHWTYSLSGLTTPAGAWDNAAAPVGPTTGTLVFDDNGRLVSVNGAASKQFNVTVSDDTVPNQTVQVDFSGLTQTVSYAPNTDSTVGQAANTVANGQASGVVGGLNARPGITSSATYTASLDSSAAAGATASTAFQWFDRNGVAHNVTLQLTKQTHGANLNETWAYSFLGLSSDRTGSGGVSWSGDLNGASSGTLAFDARGNPLTTALALRIADGTFNADGTTRGQVVAVDLSGVRNDAVPDTTAATATVTALSGSQNVAAPVPGPDATPPDPTLHVAYGGALDADLTVGSTLTTFDKTWFDRLGVGHTVHLTFEKTDTNQWTYTFNGLQDATGAWTGLAPGSTATGTVSFDEHGNLVTVNGGAAPAFDLAVADDVVGQPQTVRIDFSGLTQPGNGPTTDTTVQTAGASMQSGGSATFTSGGSSFNPGLTRTATYDGHLDSKAAVGTSVNTHFNWFDRDGVAHDVLLTLVKSANDAAQATGLADTWGYTLTAASAGVWAAGLATTGTVAFGNDGNVARVNGVGGRTATATVTDGTNGNQVVTLDFSTLRNDAAPTTPFSGSADGTATAPDPTLHAAVAGALDAREAVGFSFTSPATTWYDRLGVGHATTVTFHKTDTHIWGYTINGLQPAPPSGSWTGLAPSATASGSVIFDELGHLVTAPQFDVTVADDVIGAHQTVRMDFSGLGETSNGTTNQNFVAAAADGSIFTHSTQVTFGSRVVSGQGPVMFNLSSIVDKTGMNAVSGGQVVFYQIKDTNQWVYNVVAPTTSGFTGQVRNGSGVATFNDAGNLITPHSFVANLDDGTPQGQDLDFVIAALQMGRASDLDGSRTDGVAYSAAELNAQIYYSGGGSSRPVMVLEDVGSGARTANLGGVRFTVNKVGQDDVGLTSYLKSYDYAAPEAADRSLQFQVGADEGQTLRLGISRLDVPTLFRMGDGYDFTDVNLKTAIQAEDLIGQVDDAIQFVSAQNLKVGQFQNNLERMLALQRTNSASITNAFSNINDADMAQEAIHQSRQSILLQAALAMVAQSNTNAQTLLQLLR